MVLFSWNLRKIAGKYCDDQVVKSCPSNEVEGVCRDVACQACLS